jgi:proline-specific peptidase
MAAYLDSHSSTPRWNGTRRGCGESPSHLHVGAGDCRSPVSARWPYPSRVAREGFVEWRAGRTWFRLTGESGRLPLLCLHGGPGSTHHYFAPLERLADERRVVLYDQLGCGRSNPEGEPEWSVALFLEELEALREHLGLDRVHLLGTSWGGMLALEHALARQETLASLVLSSTLASTAEWEAEAKRLRAAIPSDDDEEALVEFEARHFFRRGDEPSELRRMRAERGSAVYEAMWGPNEWTLTGALRGWDVRARLSELTLPTLIIRGAHDMATEAITEGLAAGIPHARRLVLPESSHTPVLEETERYLGCVRQFLCAVEGQ